MKVAFIGGGNMTSAIVGGLLARGAAAAELSVVEIFEAARERIAGEFGVDVYATGEVCVPGCDIVVIAVKPQQVAEAVKPLAHLIESQLVISIAAGIRAADLKRWLDGYANIVRAMPNTPALVRAGITGLYPMPQVGGEARAAAEELLKAVGEVIWFADEAALDAVTALSGSGPAYVFYFLEALADAGAALGLEPEASRRLSLQTLLGAAKLAAASSESPEELRVKVTSRGGTTECAVAHLEAANVKQRFIEAVAAAHRRSRELGDEFGAAS